MQQDDEAFVDQPPVRRKLHYEAHTDIVHKKSELGSSHDPLPQIGPRDWRDCRWGVEAAAALARKCGILVDRCALFSAQ